MQWFCSPPRPFNLPLLSQCHKPPTGWSNDARNVCSSHATVQCPVFSFFSPCRSEISLISTRMSHTHECLRCPFSAYSSLLFKGRYATFLCYPPQSLYLTLLFLHLLSMHTHTHTHTHKTLATDIPPTHKEIQMQ